jgi:hypothetical protein
LDHDPPTYPFNTAETSGLYHDAQPIG